MGDETSALQRSNSRRASGEVYFASPSDGGRRESQQHQLRTGMSIVMQDNNLELSGILERRGQDLGRTYQQVARERDAASASAAAASRAGGFHGGPVRAPNRRPETTRGTTILPRRTFSFESSLQHRGQIHLQSADLFDTFSPVQRDRQEWRPRLPEAFERTEFVDVVEVDAPELVQLDGEELQKIMPNTFGKPCLEVISNPSGSEGRTTRPLRLGLVLSGGPAPGGHNVISGVYDYIKEAHPESQLFGFTGGLDGLFTKKYKAVDDETMHRFRNMGGFDMLWSGRGRINGPADLEVARTACNELGLHGLIIIGGDGSNSNAALLAEHFAVHSPQCSVIGVPKTIDGDLRNPWIETSFGFDTAAKTYSELIGNLCTDVTTAQQTYHFVRVMGRSASHLVLECALQTRPNLVFIGEEVHRNNTTLKEIVGSITDLIEHRLALGKKYGIILVPEGLIEFIPEVSQLINELNKILVADKSAAGHAAEVASVLSPKSREVWTSLPEIFQEQLLSDREATGYIQVAKIATERLLRGLVETELTSRGIDIDQVPCMTHYFGYEGRCPMPSNFDANYCYTLGHAAGALVQKRKTGYMVAVRGLEHDPAWWRPGAVPFTRVMEIKHDSEGTPIPAVTRQLVDLDGKLFKVLCEVRETWKLKDCYRVPGPIQFEGEVADIADCTVAVPTKEDLLWGYDVDPNDDSFEGIARRHFGCLSPLQRARLRYRPEIPQICVDPYARATEGAQHLPKDPFTLRQILLYYPYMSKSNKFALTHIESCPDEAPIEAGLTVGVVFLSRQSPGVMNVLWGVHERMKIVGGRTLGFYGTDGLMDGRYVEITDPDLELYKNQGGMGLLGRSDKHSLLTIDNQEKARQTCDKLRLDGLIIVGSSLAITEAALTAEYFLAKGSSCSIIGVPATGSNNLTHELIETNIGFDTSSKLYAGLIGNVLTDAASMPKYWHFVRLMGRQPSNEVLECALQTHPNVCIIAEEYGIANKNLADVVSDIADVVCQRAEVGKNFGSVLIPDGLLSHLPNMKALMNEFATLVRDAERAGQLRDFQFELETLDEPSGGEMTGTWCSKVTPWSLALFKSLPKFIRKELVQLDMGEMRFTLLETELLVSQMVKAELERRRKEGTYKGKFNAVTHFFGYQGRSSLPSQFDCRLAFAYGHLAAVCVESELRSHCCTIRGLVGDWRQWKLSAIPFNCMFCFVAAHDDIHPDLRNRQSDMPIIPSAEVKLHGKAYNWMKTACSQWILQDRFCNPGPVQFYGNASSFYHRILHEEQAEYYEMLRAVQFYSEILRGTCSFGVEERFLRVAFSHLHSLLALRFHDHDLLRFLPPVADIERFAGPADTHEPPPNVVAQLANLRAGSSVEFQALVDPNASAVPSAPRTYSRRSVTEAGRARTRMGTSHFGR